MPDRQHSDAMDRRDFIAAGLGMAAATLLARETFAMPALTTTALPVRRLGRLDVSALGLGCMSMAPGFYDDPPPDRAAMVALIRAAWIAASRSSTRRRCTGHSSARRS